MASAQVRLWDLRRPSGPLALFAGQQSGGGGHRYAVRRVRFSPHAPALLLSASYDTTVCLWDTAAAPQAVGSGGPAGAGGALLTAAAPARRYTHHSEFVVGLEWSLFEEGVAASCGWDSSLVCWRTAVLKNWR